LTGKILDAAITPYPAGGSANSERGAWDQALLRFLTLPLSLRLCRSEQRQFYRFGSRVTKSYELSGGTARPAKEIATRQDDNHLKLLGPEPAWAVRPETPSRAA